MILYRKFEIQFTVACLLFCDGYQEINRTRAKQEWLVVLKHLQQLAYGIKPGGPQWWDAVVIQISGSALMYYNFSKMEWLVQWICGRNMMHIFARSSTIEQSFRV